MQHHPIPDASAVATVADPLTWWRRLCFPIPNLAVSGDLDTASERSVRSHLADWIGAGVTDIVDVRGEASDESLVAALAPGLHYHWVGTHDDGGAQSEEWFDSGVTAALGALAAPDRTVLVHCHMGVNRGPSLAYATLLALGHDVVEALELIRTTRPIAAVLYARDAVCWWHHRFGAAAPERSLGHDLQRVDDWHHSNPIDVGWVISRIARSRYAA